MNKYDSGGSFAVHNTQDDHYNTRQHAFNIGVAYGAVLVALCLCAVIVFKLQVVWLLRGMLVSFMLGVIAFAKALINFTQEARDIQWESSMPKREPVAEVPYKELLRSKIQRATFPSPLHKKGMLFTSVELDNEQKERVVEAGLQHGKLTVNYLTSLGIKRENAERLREELVSHGLLSYNDRHEAVLTEQGVKSFRRCN